MPDKISENLPDADLGRVVHTSESKGCRELGVVASTHPACYETRRA